MNPIVINGTVLCDNITGIPRYVYETVVRLDKLIEGSGLDVRIAYRDDGREIHLPELKNIKLVPLKAVKYFYNMAVLSAYLRREHAFFVGLASDMLMTRRSVVVLHDIRPLVMDTDRGFFRFKFWVHCLSTKWFAQRVFTVSDNQRHLISEKLGIPERVIEAAQQHLSAEDKRLDAVLGQLDDLKLQLKESQDEVEELRNEAAHQLDAARKKRDELIQQGENELEAARAKARALAQQVESKAYALTDELRQLQKDEQMSTQQKAQRAREIAKKESEKLFIGTEVVHNPVKEFVPLKEVKVGQEVCIAELNQLATVLALPDKNGDVLVRAGIIKTKVPLLGLKQPEKLVKEPQAKTKAQQRYSRLTGDANRPNGRVERVQRSAKMECNLLGLTVDEALPEVDSFIDRAILNGQTVVYLIHGNGTGALRTAIHKHLRGNRMVKSFRLGRYGEGESGVTVVELK